MTKVVVRYKVKPGKSQENIEYLEAIFATLDQDNPDGLRFASFQLEDGVSFVHIGSIETEDGSNPLQQLDAFKAFVKDIGERCEEQPLVSDATAVGAYRVF